MIEMIPILFRYELIQERRFLLDLRLSSLFMLALLGNIIILLLLFQSLQSLLVILSSAIIISSADLCYGRSGPSLGAHLSSPRGIVRPPIIFYQILRTLILCITHMFYGLCEGLDLFGLDVVHCGLLWKVLSSFLSPSSSHLSLYLFYFPVTLSPAVSLPHPQVTTPLPHSSGASLPPSISRSPPLLRYPPQPPLLLSDLGRGVSIQRRMSPSVDLIRDLEPEHTTTWYQSHSSRMPPPTPNPFLLFRCRPDLPPCRCPLPQISTPIFSHLLTPVAPQVSYPFPQHYRCCVPPWTTEKWPSPNSWSRSNRSSSTFKIRSTLSNNNSEPRALLPTAPTPSAMPSSTNPVPKVAAFPAMSKWIFPVWRPW